MAGLSHRTIGLSLLTVLMCAGIASAQESDRSFGFLEQLFGNSDRAAPEQAPAPDRGPATGRMAQSGGELGMRLDRLEAQIRQLTGAIEQLQYLGKLLAQGTGARGTDPVRTSLQDSLALLPQLLELIE